VEISTTQLATALIRAGFYFPSQRGEAEQAARDIFLIINQEEEEACGPPI
jgi:hypothetical protein